MCYLYEVQTTASQTIWISPTTLYFGTLIKFNFYRFYQKTLFLLWFWYHSSYSGLPVKTSHIHSHLWYYYFNGISTPFCCSYLFKTWSSISYYIWLWLWVYLSLFLLPRYRPRYKTSLYQQLPSGGKWSSRMDQLDIGIVPLHIL